MFYFLKKIRVYMFVHSYNINITAFFLFVSGYRTKKAQGLHTEVLS